MTQKIVPNLWFDTEAEEAARYYSSIFKNSRIVDVSHYTEAGPREEGMVLTVDFELEDQKFTAINGGPDFKFNEAISLLVNCNDQTEIDALWEKFIADGGEAGPCGWLKDKYGVSWQIVPVALEKMVLDEDKSRVNNVMKAMLQMGKLDVAELERAYHQTD
jgi:predicted 3-demethylubiquinone-9 3-methyltransferase (glyoxalase superfamily)